MTWDKFIKEESNKSYYQSLMRFIEEEDKDKVILPPKGQRFTCFNLTPYENVRVVILGQDPYHDYNQAHGLAFSVEQGNYPPSLKNIYKELIDDLDFEYPKTGNLSSWAKQGVLLLNTILTVELHQALSHQKKGWETFTLEAIKKVNDKDEMVVFILWGGKAKKFLKYIDQNKHKVIMSAHPSPLSVYRGFYGSKPFSKTNQCLKEAGFKEIDWRL